MLVLIVSVLLEDVCVEILGGPHHVDSRAEGCVDTLRGGDVG